MRIKFIYVLLILLLVPFLVHSENQFDPSKFYTWYNFEKNSDWTTADWSNNSLSNPVITTDYASEGKKSLEISLNAGRAGQQGVVQLFDTGDMSGMNAIKFDIYNSSLVPMNLFIMLKTGANWLYHESKKVKIKPGWNKDITFDLKSQEFGADNKYNTAIKEPDKVRRFGIVVEPSAKTDGFICLDNVMIKGDKVAGFIPEKEPERLQDVLIDDFESGRVKWSAAGTWSCATKTERTYEQTSNGQAAMKAEFNMTMPGQNAVFMIEDSVDMTDVYEFKFDVYYPYDFPTGIAMALSTGDKWVWQESNMVRLKKGWNKDVTINLKEKKWKNERSKWESTVTPDDLTSVKRICLEMFPANLGEGYVIFDNIRMSTTDPGKIAGLRPVDIAELAFYPWESFEKGVKWQTSSDQSGATAVRPVFNFGGEQNKGMEIVFSTQSNVDKGMYVYKSKIDFSGSAGIKFSVYNPMTTSVQVSLAFQTGASETWIETKTVGIGPGWNRDIFFDFTTPSMKSELSNWNYTDYFETRDDIRDMIIQVYPNQRLTGSLYITDFMLARHNFLGDTGKTAGFIFSNNSSVSFEPVRYKLWDNGNAEGSFESSAALSVWTGANMSGWGAAKAEISDKYASQGKHSLKFIFKNGFNGGDIKSGLQATPPVDISPYSRLAFDVYNPGRKQKLTVAFKTDNASNNMWYEINTSVIINPGWNKNISFDLNSSDWQRTLSSVQASPVAIDIKDHMAVMYLVFHGGYEGTMYIDNIRWGEKSQARISDGDVEQDISLMITPDKAVEAKVNLKAAYYHGQNNELTVDSAHLILRGFGNELSLFSGEPVKAMDDIFGIIDPNTLGPNLMGASLAGTVYTINTSYMFSGLSLNNSGPWRTGSTSLATARLKTYFLDKNYVGLIYMNERRGYDDGANVLTGDYEQATHVYGADTSLVIPAFDVALINLKGEALMTSYQSANPLYMIDPALSIYSGQNILDSYKKMFVYGETDIRAGYLQVYAMYRQIDPYFAAYYFNPDYSAGHLEKDAKITYTMDEVFPFSAIRLISRDFASFVRNTQLMCEYDETDSYIDTYGKHAVTVELKNDESLAFYNYHIWFKYNNEGNDIKIPSISLTGITKLLILDRLTLKLLGRYENTMSYYYGGIISSTAVNLDMLVLYAETSLQLSRELKLTGSYKSMMLSDNTSHGNWYAEFDANLFDSLSLVLSYGGMPFDGYWYDDSYVGSRDRHAATYNDTQTIYTASLKGRF